MHIVVDIRHSMGGRCFIQQRNVEGGSLTQSKCVWAFSLHSQKVEGFASSKYSKRIYIKDLELLNDIMKGKICPYCKRKTSYEDSAVVYGVSYGMIYLCSPCKAWVGVHKGTDRALGRLANKQLRDLKKQAHSFFDRLWKSGLMNRKEAYKWLGDQMGLSKNQTHIGMFNAASCAKAIILSKEKYDQITKS